MKFLHPMKVRPLYTDPVEKAIEDYLYQIIFKPIVAIIKDHTKQPITLLNVQISKISQAMKSGKIQYTDGVFSGKFKAETGKELRDLGATFDWRSNTYKIDPKLMPAELLQISKDSALKSSMLHDAIKAHLDRTMDSLESNIVSIKIPGDTVVARIEQDFHTAAKALIVTPQLSAGAKQSLIGEYNDSLKLHIKDWKQTAIEKLRDNVEVNSLEGNRYDNLIQRIQEQYAVSQNKARFLARQETGLFMAKFRKERFEDAGVTTYKWSARGPSMTRPDHWRLNSKFFEYKNPPIIDIASGRRGNPGEDFGCIPGDSKIEITNSIEKLFRRRYTGKITMVVMASGKTIRATPNHQVLTTTGWKAISTLNSADNLINLDNEISKSFKLNINNNVPMISQIFTTFSKNFSMLTRPTTALDFHGDGIKGEVDIIDATRRLSLNRIAAFFNGIKNSIFTKTNSLALSFSLFFKEFCPEFIWQVSNSSIGLLSHSTSFSLRSSTATKQLNFMHSSPSNSIKQKNSTNCTSTNFKFNRYSLLTYTFFIQFYNFFSKYIANYCSIIRSTFSKVCRNIYGSKLLRKISTINANNISDSLPIKALSKQHNDPVLYVFSEDFTGHVFNLQTNNNWYTSNGYIIHNCLCVDIPALGYSGKIGI